MTCEFSVFCQVGTRSGKRLCWDVSCQPPPNSPILQRLVAIRCLKAFCVADLLPFYVLRTALSSPLVFPPMLIWEDNGCLHSDWTI